MSMITALNISEDFFDTLTNLNEKKAPSQIKDSNNNLRNLNMEKDETVASFFTNIYQVRDHITSLGLVKDGYDLLQNIINGPPSAREIFLAAVNSREEKINFEILWHDFL